MNRYVKNRLTGNLFLRWFLFSGITAAVLFTCSCHYYQLEKQLSPDHADFINKVRYIISTKEKRLFLDLPDEEKEEFIREFWEKRDPDPTTEENEFRMEYYNRIEQANKMFVSEGLPGWLTDRGRIYILFGPPMDRITYPQSYSGRCQEIWHYGNFPVVFVDRACTGSYKLVTYDLTGLREINLMYMHELGRAQADAQQTVTGREGFFNFDWSIQNVEGENNRFSGTLALEIPYANMWFTEEGEDLVTVLSLQIELDDVEDELIWDYEESLEVRIPEEELKNNKKGSFRLEIPFVVDAAASVQKLKQGKNSFYATLVNQTGEARLKKVIRFSYK
jgi:GWxTD domain-containing protein